MTFKQFWSVLRGCRTNYRFLNMSWTYKPEDKPMSDLISRADLLEILRVERQTFINQFASQDGQPERRFNFDFGELLDQIDQKVDLVEAFPAVEPIATLVNNNQAGWINLIETAPNVTIDIGTKLYRAARS